MICFVFKIVTLLGLQNLFNSSQQCCITVTKGLQKISSKPIHTTITHILLIIILHRIQKRKLTLSENNNICQRFPSITH